MQHDGSEPDPALVEGTHTLPEDVPGESSVGWHVMTRRNPLELAPGRRIQHYELIRELGRGGMGQVFLARDIKLGRRVAIKFLLADPGTSSGRFVKEARATARCQHENIVVIHEVGEVGRHPFMVLEYLEGQTIHQWLRARTAGFGSRDALAATMDAGTATDRSAIDATSGGPATEPIRFSAHRAIDIMIPVLRALAHAHDMGIIHRDLKPSNILVTDAGQIKVLDFGIATRLSGVNALRDDDAASVHATDGTAGMTATGRLVGTLPYMSPEQWGADDIDARSDIWAVGIIFWDLCVGRHPLAPLTRSNLSVVAQLGAPMPSIAQVRPELGPLADIVDGCLRKHKHERIATARELLRALEQLLPGRRRLALAGDESPFAGLAAFQAEDCDRFYGRTEDIAALLARIRSQPVVVVAGPSGVGKSSLIRAGVIPALERAEEGWESLTLRPGRRPLDALSGLLSPEGAAAPGDAESREALVARLRIEPGYLGARLRARAVQLERRTLIFIDQFEEIYTLNSDPDTRDAFFACLSGMADDATSPLRLVVSMRSDFLERLADIRSQRAVSTRGLTLLAPMDRSGLRAALVKPVEAADYRFETPEMVEDLLTALEDTRGALPLLQFAATTLWQKRDRERRLLTRASYDAMGGITGALAAHADAVLAGMSSSLRTIARRIFEQLITPERTRALANVDELLQLPGDPDEITRVLEDLSHARLIVTDTGTTGDGTVELIHEALIHGWPTLRRWLDENQDDAEFLDRLRTAARAWHLNDRNDGLLWRGQVAAEARRMADRLRDAPAGREQQFLQAVFAHADRAIRRRRVVLAAVATVLVLLLVAGTVALVKTQEVATIQAQELQLRAQQQQLQTSLDAARKAREAETAAKLHAENEQRAAESARDLERRQRQMTAEALEQAEAERKQAETQRLRAEKQEQLAVAAKEQAEAARVEAETATRESERLRRQADKAREEIDRQRKLIQSLIERQGIKNVELPTKKRGGG